MKTLSCTELSLPVALTNVGIRNSFASYKEYYARASGTIPPKTKGSKKKANTDAIPKLKPPTAPKEKKSGKAKLKTTELKTISEADLTEAEQLKIITKRSRQETHSSHASGSGADEGTGVTPGVPDAPNYDSCKNDVNETTQDDEDDDDHDDDEKVQDDDEHDIDETVQEDDDEEQTESDNDDDSSISSSDEEDSDNEVEGTNVEGAKSDEEATYEEDQGNEAVKDTNTDLDGRDEVMTDVRIPQVQATQEIEDTHVTLTPEAVDVAVHIEIGEAMHSTDVFKGPADQEFETGVQDEQAEEEVQHLPDWFQKPTRLPSADHAWNTYVLPFMNLFKPWSYKANREIRDLDNPEGSPILPHDLPDSQLPIQDIEDMLPSSTTRKSGQKFSVEERIGLCSPYECLHEELSSRGVWKIFNWVLKATRRNSTSQSLTPKVIDCYAHDELHKFSDGTLDDVRTALNDRLKGIRMEYLPQTFWSQRDKANARAMIQAIDKRLKTRRIMRSLERFVGGRPYGGDLRLLQRTI
ncbi:hypothetical protein Tco_0175271 [Tanacetum coccineum]